jgi:hypothetical protein
MARKVWSVFCRSLKYLALAVVTVAMMIGYAVLCEYYSKIMVVINAIFGVGLAVLIIIVVAITVVDEITRLYYEAKAACDDRD